MNYTEDFTTLDRYFRTANYLSAAQLYLQDNPILERPLTRDDIKARILGHWGTVPGQNFIYAHLSRAIKKFNQKMVLISGPGHGGNFFFFFAYIEGTYSEIYPAYTRDKVGIQKLCKAFSFPGGVSSHVAPQIPGSMHEGGELGYSLAHGFGAVLDQPDLVAAVIIGDGEAETGPLSASWWGTRFLNSQKDGNVLPILHLNGYKIANPTLLARISPAERQQFFAGLGYEAIEIVVGRNPENIIEDHQAMANAIDYCLQCYQTKNGKHPLIILNSPKGWTGPVSVDGKTIAGTFNAHQVPVDMSQAHHVQLINDWLQSYKPQELFNTDGTIQKDILSFCPTGKMRLSANPVTYGSSHYTPLVLPQIKDFFVPTDAVVQDMNILSNYVASVMQLNPNNFRFFCPDEAKSNRLYAPFKITNRTWQVARYPFDDGLAHDGRIMDGMLSEHVCEGMLEGYTLTGRHGFFVTYEAFGRVVDSMLNQHAKWLKQTRTMPWRTPLPCLNFINSSHTWQQDHNGYSHQDTGMATHLLDKDPSVVRCYFPADANTLLAVFDKCMHDTNKINLITASKHPTHGWRTGTQALSDVQAGISIWVDVPNPDVVLACMGDTPTTECMAAMKILKSHMPNIRIRLVNVIDAGILSGREDSLNQSTYAHYFTNDKPVVFVTHTYRNLIYSLIVKRPNSHLYTVKGYRENGAITTAFDMRVLNEIDRFHIVKDIIDVTIPNPNLSAEMDEQLKKHRAYILEHGVDPDWVNNF
ncbi:MAG: phosphoketolase family protein [Clostridia bacterium]|nr:phosphoketolase family protein [Clostridia bacterium]